jgi:peroxiredoxin
MHLQFRFVVFLLFFALNAEPREITILQPGTPAPLFSLPSLTHGRQNLRAFCGDTLFKPHINKTRHIVVVNFWATYCKPCQREIPELMKFAEKHNDERIKIFCISIDKEGAAVAGPFADKKKYTLPILLDPYRKTAQRYGVTALPVMFVIDEKGVIRYASLGYDDQQPVDRKLETIIASIRTGKAVPESPEGTTAQITDTTKETPSAVLSPRNRWDAIVAVECGMELEHLADSLDVQPEEIKKWYADLKKAAIALWEKGQQP